MKITTIAHRGLRENQLAGFVSSYNQGFNICECDIWFTADNEIVLCHNATLEETAGDKPLSLSDAEFTRITTTPISALTLKDVQKVLLKLTGTPAPRLQDVLAIMPSDGKLFVEIKQRGPQHLTSHQDLEAGFLTEANLKALVQATLHYTQQLTFISFIFGNLLQIRRNLPQCDCIHLLVGNPSNLERGDCLIQTQAELQVQLEQATAHGFTGLGIELNSPISSPVTRRAIHEQTMIVHHWYDAPELGATLLVNGLLAALGEQDRRDVLNLDSPAVPRASFSH